VPAADSFNQVAAAIERYGETRWGRRYRIPHLVKLFWVNPAGQLTRDETWVLAVDYLGNAQGFESFNAELQAIAGLL
jgi:hypothetical protein